MRSLETKSKTLRYVMLTVVLALALTMALAMTSCGSKDGESTGDGSSATTAPVTLDSIPAYDGELCIELNGNKPSFTDAELKEAKESYKFFGDLDNMGRCSVAEASISRDTMPDQSKESRGDISEVHPSGWHSGMEWERMHLIAWSLSGENANPMNLITGTHDCNYNAMRPKEIETAQFLEDNPRKHVLYRVTPVFYGKEQIARGVQMEAESVEDKGRGLSFNVYCYNVRTDGAVINYKTGTIDYTQIQGETKKSNEERLYVLNLNSKKFHYPSCSGVADISDRNKKEVTATRQDLINQGFDPCGMCEP